MKREQPYKPDWIRKIQDDWDRMENMSCKPTRKRYPQGYVFDEDKSVRWNQEKVQAENNTYNKQVAELNTAKNKAHDAVCEEIYEYIMEAVNKDLPVSKQIDRYKASKIWEYLYNEAKLTFATAKGSVNMRYLLATGLAEMIAFTKMLLSKSPEKSKKISEKEEEGEVER